MAGTVTIAHLLFGFGRGGMESVLARVINTLDSRRYRHVIVTTSRDRSLLGNITSDNVTIYTIEAPSLTGKLVALIRTIKREQVDLIHARGWSLMLEGGVAGLLCRLPAIYSFHGKTFGDVVGYPWRRRLAELLVSRLYDEVVTLTAAMGCDLQSSLMLRRGVRLIPNGVSDVSCSPGGRQRARAALGIGEGEFVVGFAGRLDPVKDLDTLLLAFAAFAAGKPGVRLVLVGEGECREALERLAAREQLLDRVIWAGFRGDVQELMQGFDLYLQTSIYEGLSNTILEAFSVGLPVVCTAVGGNADLVVDGENGFLIAPGDDREGARRLEQLYASGELRSAMSRRNREKQRQHYSYDRMTRSYDELYSFYAARHLS